MGWVASYPVSTRRSVSEDQAPFSTKFKKAWSYARTFRMPHDVALKYREKCTFTFYPIIKFIALQKTEYVVDG
jgi:hypothetical protein